MEENKLAELVEQVAAELVGVRKHLKDLEDRVAGVESLDKKVGDAHVLLGKEVDDLKQRLSKGGAEETEEFAHSMDENFREVLKIIKGRLEGLGASIREIDDKLDDHIAGEGKPGIVQILGPAPNNLLTEEQVRGLVSDAEAERLRRGLPPSEPDLDMKGKKRWRR